MTDFLTPIIDFLSPYIFFICCWPMKIYLAISDFLYFATRGDSSDAPILAYIFTLMGTAIIVLIMLNRKVDFEEIEKIKIFLSITTIYILITHICSLIYPIYNLLN